MTPVDQEFISDPSIGQFGDCARAVIASLLDISIKEVPHFLAEAKGEAYEFWDGIFKFCESKGYLYVPMNSDCFEWPTGQDIYHEISGPSPRGNGLLHAVVGCNGKIVFDPHQSRAGLLGDPSEWKFSFLVKK